MILSSPISDRYFHEWFSQPICFQSWDLILFRHQYWDLLCLQWIDNCSSNSFPWILLILYSSGNFFQDAVRCSSATKSKVYCTDWEKHQKFSQEEFYLCRCSMTFPVDQKTTKKNVWQMPNSYLCTRGDLEKGQWSFIGPGSEKKWYCISGDSRQGVWDNIAERMLLEFAEKWTSYFPCKREHCPEVDSKSKGRGQLSIDFAADLETVETIFRIINCLCKPAQSLRSSRGDVWRVWIPSRENGETRCDGAIEFLTRAQCDQDRSSFGLWWPSEPRSSIAAIWATNWKAVTTRQIE